MHPLVYFAIVEFDRQEMLRNVERERQHRELRRQQELERHGHRVGHGQVARPRPGALARLGSAVRSAVRSAMPSRTAAHSPTSAGRGDATVIGCRA